MEVVNPVELSRNDSCLVLLVHFLDKRELLNPLARDGLDTGSKSRKPDDALAAHLFQRVILKV